MKIKVKLMNESQSTDVDVVADVGGVTVLAEALARDVDGGTVTDAHIVANADLVHVAYIECDEEERTAQRTDARK